MGIGASVLLIAVGLILALAVDYEIPGVDLTQVGWILTAVGALGLLITLVLLSSQRSRGAAVREEYPPEP